MCFGFAFRARYCKGAVSAPRVKTPCVKFVFLCDCPLQEEGCPGSLRGRDGNRIESWGRNNNNGFVITARGQAVGKVRRFQVTLIHPQEADRVFSRCLTEALRVPEAAQSHSAGSEPHSLMKLMTPETGILVHRLSIFLLFWPNLEM